MKPPHIMDPARILAASWLERHGWKEKCDENDRRAGRESPSFDDLVEDVGALLAEMLTETETQKKAAEKNAFERARALCERLAKAVREDASKATEPETRERFRAMASAHEHDQQAIARMMSSAGPQAGAKRSGG